MDPRRARIDSIIDTFSEDQGSAYNPEMPKACLRCLEFYTGRMNQQTLSALSTAREYWDGKRTDDELTEARIQCWHTWDDFEKRRRDWMAEAVLIRALIFVLYPPGVDRDSPYVLMHGFLEELDCVGPDYDSQLLALEEFLRARGLPSPD